MGGIDNSDNGARFDNSVKWMSAIISGLQLDVMYSLGGVAGSLGSGQAYSVAANYTHGPLQMAAGALHIDNGNAAYSMRGTSSSDSLFNSAVNSAYASARSIEILRAGGNYAFGPLIFGGYYDYTGYMPDAASKFTTREKYNVGSLYARWAVTVPLFLEVGYIYMKTGGDSSAKYNQFALSLDYFLSKRTDIYAYGGYTHASGANGLGAAQAVVGSTDINSGRNAQGIVSAGIRTAF